MEAPISASQGAMRSLPRKLESLLSGPNQELRAAEKKKLRVLQADLQELIDNYLIEPSEVVFPASTANSWMNDVRELSYDIDDFIYELAHLGDGGARISVVQKPPRFKISRFPEKLRRRQWIPDEISRFRTRVKEAIRLHIQCLGNCKLRPSSSAQPPPSPSGRLVGVDSSIQQLCGMLANDGLPEHRVVSIVGTAGVGKTTLARQVYRRIGGQFQCLAFLRTSPNADMEGLLTSLLSQVRRCRHVPGGDALDVHRLVVNTNEHLQHKTYLIVIEDLWALSTWDLVNRALPKGNWCSRIITTTEADVIAQACCADNFKFNRAKKEDKSKYMSSEKEDKPKYTPSREKNNPMYMPSKKENNSKYIIKKEPLSENDSRELFLNIAFGKQAECPQALKEVSNEIIKISGGLPLGINILASLLAHQPASSIEQWNYIKNSLSSDLTTHASWEKIYQVLNIGYDNLPHDLKACMLYLCLYEEDCIIWMDDLVKQWISEGFISAVKGEDEEEVAHSYFGELVNRGMIQPVDTNCSDEILSCRVHHMVLHFIRDKSMEDNFCIAIDHSQTTIRLADKVRRLALHLGNVEHATPPGPESMRLSKVRSLAFSGYHKCMPSVVEFRFLQVLNLKLLVDPNNMMSDNLAGFDDLSGNLTGSDDMSGNLTGSDVLTDNLSEPDGLSYNLAEISELFRLRYFHLDACHVSVALPTKMQHLKYLVAWEIDAKVAAVPSDIVDLPSLLYLRIPSEAHLPTGIGRMTSLRTLGVFDLSKNSTEDVMSLSELTNLQDLRLTCSTLQPDNLEKNLECLGKVILKLSNLKCVTLVPAVSSHLDIQHNSGASSMSTSWNGFDIVPLLPALLQKLEFSWHCCLFSSLPEWTKELTKLCILKIAVRKVSKEDVVILKGLPSLTALSLFIWTIPAIKIIFDNEGFSFLKYFKFVCAAPRLEFLDGAMPNVRKLKLGFNANRMDIIAGLKRLIGLNEISIKIGDPGTVERQREPAASVLTDAIGMHPSTPIINVQWVDWNFCGEHEKHSEPREEIGDQTSEQQYVTAGESSEEHGIQKKNLDEDAKKQPDTRIFETPKLSFPLQNTGIKLSSVEKHPDAVAEKPKVDSDGYGEIDKLAAVPRSSTIGTLTTRPDPLGPRRPAGEMTEAIAGWLVCPVIRIVINKAKCCAANLIRLFNGGLCVALEQLDVALTQLHTVANAVERSPVARGSGGGDLDRWLLQLKDPVHEADEVVDEFEYRCLRPDGGKADRARSSLVKFGKQIVGADESLNRLNNVIEKLGGILASSERLMQVAELEASRSGELNGGHHPTWDGPVTVSLLEEDEVFGRDSERKDMVSWLVGPGPPHCADRRGAAIPVAAIMGLGGMGKTTLARVVIHDDLVKVAFDLVMWVCPAATYHKVELIKQILQSAGVELPDDRTNFDWLQRRLEEAISSRRFLLVLDNVWNKGEMDRRTWGEVLAPLRCGKPGSKIIVTTRKNIVGKTLNASKHVMLDGLAFADIWSLFTRIAFRNDSVDKHPALYAIGEQLVPKLKGLPLAAKVVGRMLKSTRSVREWKKILEMESYDDVNLSLELCYRNLLEHLRPCFAICSIFPKNWRFKRDKLVKIWMALDFIRPVDERKLEDVGEEYFDQLVDDGSFFHKPKEGHKNYYYIHDLMHDLAERASRVDCARVENVEEKQIPSTVRHLSVTGDAVMHLKGWCKLDRLRTFIVLKQFSSSLCQLPDDILEELKGVRVLGLDGCGMVDLSDKIGQLIHLRYLALSKTITGIPQSLTKLLFLQTLLIPKRCLIEEFPKDMRNLQYLRHLDMNRANTSKVVGHLQRLKDIHVKREKGHTLEDRRVCGALHIKNLDAVASKQEACKAGLIKKHGLKVLELEWNSTGKSAPSVDAEVLEGLEPHPHVEEVRIRRYHGSTSPRWVDQSFKKDNQFCLLNSLYLTNCRNLEVLPPLGQLPCLKVLHLKEICSLRQIGSEFYGTNLIAFPCLTDLEFDDMPQWVEWTKEEKVISVFPKLGMLNLLNCPKLVKVPPFSLSIRKVTVRNTGFVSHMKLSFSSSSKASDAALETCSTAILTDGLLHQQQVEAISVLTLRHCQGLKFEQLQALTSLKKLQISHLDITDEQLGYCLRGLQSLTNLEIDNCSNITSLPHVENPSGLTTLHIRRCSELSSLHSLPNLAALESMSIENCSKLTVESFPADFRRLSSLKNLNIMCCTELESLPSVFPASS